MKVWQIASDSQKHEKYALQAKMILEHFYIGLLDIKEYIRNGLVF
jgi:hypothetical protein